RQLAAEPALRRQDAARRLCRRTRHDRPEEILLLGRTEGCGQRIAEQILRRRDREAQYLGRDDEAAGEVVRLQDAGPCGQAARAGILSRRGLSFDCGLRPALRTKEDGVDGTSPRPERSREAAYSKDRGRG